MKTIDKKRDFEVFIERYRGYMINSLWRVMKDVNLIDDMLQQSLLRAWQKRDLLFEHVNPVALVLRICGHVATDFLRAKLRRQARFNRYCDRGRYREDVWREEPMDRILRGELFDRVEKLISSLSVRQGMAVQMRLFEEADYEQIARKIGCGTSTARLHYWRGKEQIREALLASGYC